MSKSIDMSFCELPTTPFDFNAEKFKAGDDKQTRLYKESKRPNRDKILTYEQIMDKSKPPNYARVVPKGCIFIDFDNSHEAKRMKEIILYSGLRCLILETCRGYHFLFRTPDFYKKEMTGATNWFGYKFDTKATTDKSEAVQIIRVCGMNRKEIRSWDLTEVTTETINIEDLDVLPYWFWGKLKNSELHKGGKPGESEYTLIDTPFTQLMTMKEGGRHDHIFSKCSMFALTNGFTIEEFKSLIKAIHDVFLIKSGSSMSDSDLFSDLEERWNEYEKTMTSSSWDYDEENRKWLKLKSKKEDNYIDERRAAEYLFSIANYFVTGKNSDGTYKNLLYNNTDGSYEYRNNFPELKQKLREHSKQNFKDDFFNEVRKQLMQTCIENNKIITRNYKYVIAKNKVLSCISPDAYDFSWLGSKPPTDVVLPWNWYSREWVEEHKEDLGGLITNFIKQLSRDASGKPQPIVQDWLWVIAGASMIPANKLQKVIIMAGGGQNGKSLYTSLIRLCLGYDMFNESKIFDTNPHDNFWGEDLDKGILCVVDDMPRLYDKDALSYIKGALTGTDTVVINEKYKPKRTLEVLPQIIACTNFEFKLYDKSEGMKRRLSIIPMEFYITDDMKDFDLQHKLVLNTMDKEKIAEYQMSDEAFNYEGKKIMNMYTGEKGVQDSLCNGSLAWFANKARYMYMDYALGKLILKNTKEMERSFEQIFDDDNKGQCEEFINWHLINKCGSTDNKIADLSPANGFYHELYQTYKNEYCIAKKLTPMEESIFNNNCGRVARKSFTVKKKKNNKGIAYHYIYFNKPAKLSKK